MLAAPRIGVVVVHYGTDDLTMRCLNQLADDDVSPATRIVLVDNGPGVGIADRVRRELPDVDVVVAGRNLGFAGGANLGISALAASEFVALVNSDVLVERGWLAPLVAAMEADPRRAAVSPKMLFEGLYHELRLTASAAWRPGRGDARRLAWRLKGVEIAAADVTSSCQLVEGFWEPDELGRWAGGEAVLRVPASPTGGAVRLSIGTPPGAEVVLQCDGAEPDRLVVPAGGGWCDLIPNGPALRVINNVGNAWRDDGYGLDLGFHEVDAGQHDVATSIPAWCGGAVLLRRAYLESAGDFDERLFLYYEDLELSRRGAALGWRYWYDPSSVVSHRHAATAGRDTGRSERLKERNRLLVVLRHDGGGAFVRELVRHVTITVSYVRRDVLSPVLRGASPEWTSVRTRAAALRGALSLAPAEWRRGRAARRQSGGMSPLA